MKKSEIRELYYQFIIKKKHPPKDLDQFLSFAKLKKRDFNLKYYDLNDVESDIWKKALKDVLKCVHSQPDFMDYCQRDKGMAIMYSWFEYMNLNMRFFKNCQALRSPDPSKILCAFRKIMKKLVRQNFEQGKQFHEFKDRGLPNSFIESFFWSLMQSNLKTWKKAQKKKQEEWMDAMLEKSMILFFDSLAENIFDTFIDMIKHKKSL